MIILQSIPWIEIGRTWGVLGIIFILVVVALWKGLPWIATYLKQQQEASNAALVATVADARKERDYMRQRRDEEVNKFTESLKGQGEVFKSALQDIVRDRRQ